MRVRVAQVADAEGMTSVHVRGWQAAYDGLMPAGYLAAMDPADPERVANRRRHLTDYAGVCVYVAEDETDGVVGFVNAGPYRTDKEGDDVTGGGEVYAIYVAPERLGTGAGRALMDTAVHWLGEAGLLPVRLWMLVGNARALAFYERYGFRLDGGRSQIVLEQAGELPVELPEVRLTLPVAPLADGG